MNQKEKQVHLDLLKEEIEVLLKEITVDYDEKGHIPTLANARVELEILCHETGNITVNNLYYTLDEHLDKAATVLQKLLREVEKLSIKEVNYD